MSIVRMRKVFRKRVNLKLGKKNVTLPSWTEIVFGLIILIFLVGAFYTFGGPGSRNRTQEPGATGAGGPGVVARVNGFKISRAIFDANVQQRLSGPYGEMDFTQERYIKTSVLDSLIDAVLMRQAVKDEGIKVTSAEIEQKKTTAVDDTLAQKFPDQRRLKDFLRKKQMSLDEYKAELRREAFPDEQGLRDSIAQEKLQKQIEDKVTISDQELQDSYVEVKASHILIDPKKEAQQAQAANKDPKAAPPDGDALAKARAEKLLAQLKAGADFAKLAKECSTCPSAPKGGDLGWFKRGMMAKEFEDAAFSLQPGQLSGVVKTQFGYHIIKLTGRRNTLPKDFAKNKEMYRNQLKDQRKYRAWAEYRENLKKSAKIEIIDPELQAYRLLDEGKQQEGLQLLQQAVQENPGNLCASWELAQLDDQGGNPQAAVEILDNLATNEQAARVPMLHLRRGEIYEKLKNKAKALECYKQAADWASAFTMSNMSVNMQLEGKLKALGAKDLETQVSKWLTEYRAQQPANPMGGFQFQ